MVSVVKHFKKQVYTNLIMVGYLVIVIGFSIWAVLDRNKVTKSLLQVSQFYFNLKKLNLDS